MSDDTRNCVVCGTPTSSHMVARGVERVGICHTCYCEHDSEEIVYHLDPTPYDWRAKTQHSRSASTS